MALTDQIKEQVSFLFKDAGDSVFKIEGSGLAAMQFDVVESEAHEWSNEISAYPVEGFADISDNIRQKAAELRITGFVSNQPISGVIDTVENFTDRLLNGRKRTQEAFNQLKALRDLRVPVTVTTRFRVYTNMGIDNISIRRAPDAGDAVLIDIAFKEVIIVHTQTDTVPPGLGNNQSDSTTQQRAGAKKDAGKSTGKITKPADAPKPVKRSIAKATGSIFNL